MNNLWPGHVHWHCLAVLWRKGTDSWRVQLGEGSDGDLWEAVDLLLERMQGKVEVNWIRGHAVKRTTRRMMSKHQRGNVRADANCTAVERGVRSRVRLLLPRRKSWRLCYDGMEMVGILRKELKEKTRTEADGVLQGDQGLG